MGQGRLTATNHAAEWPKELQQAVAGSPLHESEEWQPIVIEMAKTGAHQAFKELLKTKVIIRVVDNYDEQFAELIISRNPQLYRASYEVKQASLEDYLKEHYNARPGWQLGSWVYFPWSGQLVHVLEKKLFLESRTIRNKDLITDQEQKKYAAFHVGCAGMSVGSSAALALAIQGGSQKMRIADSAVISASNLNRILTGVNSVGMPKATILARRMYEMNPYMTIDKFDENIQKATVTRFFTKPWALKAVIDEVDDLEIKILLRVEARKRRLPVLMATDLGDDVMLDVERYDLDPQLPLFHGFAGDIERLLHQEVSKREWLKYATSIINTKNVPLRMQQSLLKVGTKLVTQPQLGGTAMMAGTVLAYATRRLALGEPLESGRTMISLEAHLHPGHHSWNNRRVHRKHTKLVQRSLDAM